MAARVPGRLAGRPSVEAQAQRLLLAADRKARRAAAKAAVQASPLSEDEVKELLTPSREQLEKLRDLAAGKTKRHAASVLGALKIMLEHTVAKPKQEVGGDGLVQVVVNTLPKAEGETFQAPAGATLTAKPEEPN
jgi:hypothetical protein